MFSYFLSCDITDDFILFFRNEIVLNDTIRILSKNRSVINYRGVISLRDFEIFCIINLSKPDAESAGKIEKPVRKMPVILTKGTAGRAERKTMKTAASGSHHRRGSSQEGI